MNLSNKEIKRLCSAFGWDYKSSKIAFQFPDVFCEPCLCCGFSTMLLTEEGHHGVICPKCHTFNPFSELWKRLEERVEVDGRRKQHEYVR